MPHKKYQPEKFKEKCIELKGRFSRDANNSLFPKSDSKPVPIDGLPVYIDSTWNVIKNDKELNLPDQREMVANYRCSEIKDEAMNKVHTLIQSLKI